MDLLHLLHKYELFLVSNASQITAFESSLRSLTYILPGRFEDAEFASQALFAALNILGLYHDYILTRAAAEHAEKKGTSVTPTTFNRYTRYWFAHSNKYKRVGIMLTLISYTEVLIEMGVKKKWGQVARWRIVIAIEIIKVLCRFQLLGITKNRTILHPTHPERDVDPATLQVLPPDEDTSNLKTWKGSRTGALRARLPATIQLQPKKPQALTRMNEFSKEIGFVGENGKGNGILEKNHPGKAQFADIPDYLFSKALTHECLKKPSELVSELNKAGLYAEYLWILRPLIYVLAIHKYGPMSYRPYLLSLALDLFARRLRAFHFTSPHTRSRTTQTQLEKDETSRRGWLLLYYILRGPFYQQYTKPRLDKFCANTESKMFIGFIANLLRDYQSLWEGVYFYTAGSS